MRPRIWCRFGCIAAILAIFSNVFADERWSMPARARIEHVRTGIQKGSEGDPVAKFCSDFRLSEQQLRTFLQRSKTITQRQLHDEFNWLPCVVTAQIRWDGHLAMVEISATLVGTVDVNDGPEYVLACDGECEKKVWRTARK